MKLDNEANLSHRHIWRKLQCRAGWATPHQEVPRLLPKHFFRNTIFRPTEKNACARSENWPWRLIHKYGLDYGLSTKIQLYFENNNALKRPFRVKCRTPVALLTTESVFTKAQRQTASKSTPSRLSSSWLGGSWTLWNIIIAVTYSTPTRLLFYL